MTAPAEIETRIVEAFEKYDRTIQLLERLFAAREHPEEIVVLACARLDALANLAGVKTTALARFIDFVQTYSGAGGPDGRISVPDLYSYLGREYTMIPLTIEVAGRLEISGSASLPFLRFLAASGLPLTDTDVSRFMQRFSIAVQRKYRTTASQAHRKPVWTGLDEFVRHVGSELERSRWKSYTDTLTPALRVLAAEFSLPALLYREVRSGAIHEHTFGVDETRFFRESEPYIDTVYHSFDDTIYLGVHVPGRWLIDLLSLCSENYKKHLLTSKRLPINLFTEICDPLEDDRYLDEASLPTSRMASINVGR